MQTEESKRQLKEEIESNLSKEYESSEVSSEDSEDSDDPVHEWTNQADHKKTYFIMSTKEVTR